MQFTSRETSTKLNSNLKSLGTRKRHNFRSLPPRSPKIIRKTSPWKHLNDSPSHNDSFLLFVVISLHALFSTLSTFRILCAVERVESFAELFYHGCSVSLIKYQTHSTQSLVLVMAFLLLSLSKLMNSLSRNECLLIR